MRVLVLAVQELHLGFLGCYGCDWVATPALDRLAADAIVFDHHYTDTCGDPRSPLTGRSPLPPPPGRDSAGDPDPDLPSLLATAGAGYLHINAGSAPVRPDVVA